MTRRPASWLNAAVAVVMLAIVIVATSSPAVAQVRDRIPPTAPTDLRVTAFTSYTVSLAWNPSVDNSGVFSYRIVASGYPGGTTTIGQSTTSVTLTTSAGVTSGYKYSFAVYAVDAAGNRSKASNIVSATLPADRTPPSAPVLSINQVTPTTVALSWTPSIDDGPFVSYGVVVNGSSSVWAGGATSITIQGLTPSTQYSFYAQGRDNWQNWSPPSNEVIATTLGSNPSDTTAPTTPRNLIAWDFGCEIMLFWTQSADDEDAPSVITYEIAVNGRLDHTVIGRDRTSVYGDANGPNTFTVTAIDVAGNRSPAASLTLTLFGC